jgi:hypothetical protein
MNVYLVFCNDMLLGVYNRIDKAKRRVDEYRETQPHAKWRQSPGDGYRWHNNEGVARLEVTTERVR